MKERFFLLFCRLFLQFPVFFIPHVYRLFEEIGNECIWRLPDGREPGTHFSDPGSKRMINVHEDHQTVSSTLEGDKKRTSKPIAIFMGKKFALTVSSLIFETVHAWYLSRRDDRCVCCNSRTDLSVKSNLSKSI
jgi:hypothetical protein